MINAHLYFVANEIRATRIFFHAFKNSEKNLLHNFGMANISTTDYEEMDSI
jgi:hypothetical protein